MPARPEDAVGLDPAARKERDSSGRGTLLVIMAGLLALPMSMSGASIAIPHIATGLDTGGAAV